MDLPVYCRLEKIKGNRDYHIQMEVITMNYSTSYSTVYIGIDAHKESFSLVSYTNEKEQAEYPQRVDAHYSKVINYIEAMRISSES